MYTYIYTPIYTPRGARTPFLLCVCVYVSGLICFWNAQVMCLRYIEPKPLNPTTWIKRKSACLAICAASTSSGQACCVLAIHPTSTIVNNIVIIIKTIITTSHHFNIAINFPISLDCVERLRRRFAMMLIVCVCLCALMSKHPHTLLTSQRPNEHTHIF